MYVKNTFTITCRKYLVTTELKFKHDNELSQDPTIFSENNQANKNELTER